MSESLQDRGTLAYSSICLLYVSVMWNPSQELAVGWWYFPKSSSSWEENNGPQISTLRIFLLERNLNVQIHYTFVHHFCSVKIYFFTSPRTWPVAHVWKTLISVLQPTLLTDTNTHTPPLNMFSSLNSEVSLIVAHIQVANQPLPTVHYEWLFGVDYFYLFYQ